MLASWIKQTPETLYHRAFTPLITLWYLIFQRLHYNHTLSAVVADAYNGGADCLSPRGKRLSRQLRSQATTSFSNARHRLPLPLLQQCLSHTAAQIRSWTSNATWLGWNVALLDGSTLRLRPHCDIRQQWPPHGGGHHKQSYWCLLRVMVSFCLSTGVVLASAQGATSLSEQVLAAQLILQALPQTLFVGDRNLGVFSVIQAVRHTQGQGLFRLTKVRARKIAQAAKLKLSANLDRAVLWAPTRHDQCHYGQSAQPIPGRLIVVRVRRPGYRPQVLYLFTTLTDMQSYSVQALVDLYAARWQVELNLRYLKTQMQLDFLDCKSTDIARKEWLAGLIAHNLIRAVMVAAATQTKVPVSILSFSRTRELLLSWLLRSTWRGAINVCSWATLLIRVGRCPHPKRRKRRPTQPRAIRYFKRAFPRLQGDRTAPRQKIRHKS